MPTTTTPDVPLPADAVTAKWQELGTSDACRYFEDSRWVIDRNDLWASSQDIETYIRGTQELDGTVKREIAVHHLHSDYPITSQQARQLARALIAAADEVDRWSAQ